MKSRAQKIREAVQEMQSLIEEKNRLADRIRIHTRQVHADLGIPRADFNAAVKLTTLAQDRKESTLANIREVLLALGQAVPTIENLRERDIEMREMWQSGKSFADISKQYGLTAARVRQIIDKTDDDDEPSGRATS